MVETFPTALCITLLIPVKILLSSNIGHCNFIMLLLIYMIIRDKFSLVKEPYMT